MTKEKHFKYVSSHLLECNLDNAVIGLIDLAHVPHIHDPWWWAFQKGRKKEAEKILSL